jgi:hypothetical protein
MQCGRTPEKLCLIVPGVSFAKIYIDEKGIFYELGANRPAVSNNG